MLIDDGLLPPQFASPCAFEGQDGDREWYARFRRTYVKFGAYLCRIKFRQNFYPDRRGSSEEPLWSDLLYYFNYYFTLKLMAATYNQFKLDYHKYTCDRFDQVARLLRQSANLSSAQVEQMAEHRSRLAADYQSAFAASKTIGAPYLRLSYVLENLYIYLALIIVAVHVGPHFYYKYWKPFDYSIMYAISAPDRLQQSIDALIRERVNTFIVSSRMYTRLLLNQTADEYARSQRELHTRPGSGGSPVHPAPTDVTDGDETDDSAEVWLSLAEDGRANAQRVLSNHRFLVGQVKSMAREGSLQPLHRRRDRLAKTANILSIISVFLFAYNIVWFATLISLGHVVIKTQIEQDLLDLLFSAELLLYGVSIVGAATFYTTLMAVVCLDQVFAAAKLNQLIEHCIGSNTASMVEYLSREAVGFAAAGGASPRQDGVPASTCRPSIVRYSRRRSLQLTGEVPPAADPPKPAHLSIRLTEDTPLDYDSVHRVQQVRLYMSVSERVNLRLLHTLMHYKIFVKQLRPLLDTIVPIFATLNQCVMFLPLILTRLLIAYLDRPKRGASIFFCALVMITTGMIRSMICWLHARCLRVYTHLQSLIAHTIAMNNLVHLRTGREVYDKHLTWILYAELNYPETVGRRFATRYLGVQASVTYANLTKSLFWWGLVAMSVFVVDSGSANTKELFGRVWRFYDSADAEIGQFFANITGA